MKPAEGLSKMLKKLSKEDKGFTIVPVQMVQIHELRRVFEEFDPRKFTIDLVLKAMKERGLIIYGERRVEND